MSTYKNILQKNVNLHKLSIALINYRKKISSFEQIFLIYQINCTNDHLYVMAW